MLPLSALTFSGWAQPADALMHLFSSEDDAITTQCLDYHAMSLDEALESIKRTRPDILIGWSLGGQIAVRAIAEQAASPKLLVLLGTPFQFVMSENYPYATPPEQLAAIRQQLRREPEQTIHAFQDFLLSGDALYDEIRPQLRLPHHLDGWDKWLTTLGEFRGSRIDFSDFPPTLVIHGETDAVVDPQQAGDFTRALPHAALDLIPGCAHAPHLHAPERIRALIDTTIQHL